MLGCGSIGQAVLRLLLDDLGLEPPAIEVVTADDRGRPVCAERGVAFTALPLDASNHEAALAARLRPGDLLVNLSVEVESMALIRLCAARGAMYVDSGLEPWAGGYTDTRLGPAERSNHALRQRALALGRELGRGPTAVICQGANPGLVSQLAKAALLQLARDLHRHPPVLPSDRAGWAGLARALDVRTIHIAERDSQIDHRPFDPDEFVATWSIDGFLGEGSQPSELGWGTHEPELPPDGARHADPLAASIWLSRPGAATRVRSWTPLRGPILGWLITHMESISLADFLTVHEDGQPVWRPTVLYAYRPCDHAVLSLHELALRNFVPPPRQRLMAEEIVAGADELGVLLAGHARNALWFGSTLTIEEARRLIPGANATAVQVAAGVLAGIVQAIEHPAQGLVEPEALDHERALAVARPYLGRLHHHYTDWTPLEGRGRLFPEPLDHADPWRFTNVRAC